VDQWLDALTTLNTFLAAEPTDTELPPMTEKSTRRLGLEQGAGNQEFSRAGDPSL
jgi:hypothetical protein